MGNPTVKGVVSTVRSYLEAIGHPISSAQGHQVVALSLGLKGKEVLAAKFKDIKEIAPAEKHPIILPVGFKAYTVEELMRMNWKMEVIIPVDADVYGNIEVLNDYISESLTNCIGLQDIGIEIADHFYGNAMIAIKVSGYIPEPEEFFADEIDALLGGGESHSDDSAGTPNTAPAPAVSCRKCDSALKDGFCRDQMCMYSDWPQQVEQHVITTMSAWDIERHYGVMKRRDEVGSEAAEKMDFVATTRSKVALLIHAIERSVSKKIEHDLYDELIDYMSSDDLEVEVCEKMFFEFKGNPDLVDGDWSQNKWIIKPLVLKYVREHLARMRPDFYALTHDLFK